MMTHAQVLDEIRHWNASDKWLLLEMLLRDLRPADDAMSSSQQQLSVQERLYIARELFGFIKPMNRSVPTDEEVNQIVREERYGKYE